MSRVVKISRTLAVLMAVGLVAFIVVANTTPFGAYAQYISGDGHLSPLGPKNRVEEKDGYSVQTGDLAYFTSDMPFNFESGTLKLQFKNAYPEQEIKLGYADKKEWHYASNIISSPFIDSLTWPKTGDGPYLYQKLTSFSTPQDFLANPPKDKVIGVYDFDTAAFSTGNIQLADYTPSSKETVFETPLRGKFAMDMYLSGEGFKLGIEKRDLNWYADPDVVSVKVYKGKDQVFETTIDDDGNNSANQKAGGKQTAVIQNPGPGLPEPGVYRVVVDATGDSAVTRISTNLHKVVFEGPLYPISNHDVYPNLIKKTLPTAIFTSAKNMSAQTMHNAQTLSVNGKALPIPIAEVPVQFDTGGVSTTITMPNSDVILNGVGFFAFSQDQYFEPTPYRILPIAKSSDVEKVDFVLTYYSPPRPAGDGWMQVERKFDLRSSVPKKRQLSWLLSAPGLTDIQGTIQIRNMELSLGKSGWSSR